MMSADEDALACDIAETYGIYDLRALPAKRLAVLSVGLRDDSRIKMKMAGMKEPLERIMSAAVVDRLTWLAWANSKDGQRGTNRPEQLVGKLLGTGKDEKEKEHVAYASGEDFEAERQRILERVRNGADDR